MTTNGRFLNGEAELSRLRVTVAAIEHELARLPLDAPPALLASFAELVDQLDLGPEPEVRDCPVCHQAVRRTARLCGHCWSRLEPVSLGD